MTLKIYFDFKVKLADLVKYAILPFRPTSINVKHETTPDAKQWSLSDYRLR